MRGSYQGVPSVDVRGLVDWARPRRMLAGACRVETRYPVRSRRKARLQQQIEDLRRPVPLFHRKMLNLRIDDFESTRECQA